MNDISAFRSPAGMAQAQPSKFSVSLRLATSGRSKVNLFYDYINLLSSLEVGI